MNSLTFGVKRSKFKDALGVSMLENVPLALSMQCLEYYWTKFHKTLVIGVPEAKDTLVRF